MRVKKLLLGLLYLTLVNGSSGCKEEEINPRSINISGTYDSTLINGTWDNSSTSATPSDTSVMDVVLRKTSDSTYFFSLWTITEFTYDKTVSKSDSIVLNGIKGYPFEQWLVVSGKTIRGRSIYYGKYSGTNQQLTGVKVD